MYSYDKRIMMNKETKKVFLRSFGCQMNVHDSEVIAGLLKVANYELTANPDDADVVIFNTSSVRQLRHFLTSCTYCISVACSEALWSFWQLLKIPPAPSV
jgi:hypothetical protein